MGGNRHGINQTANACYSYHERMKDKMENGYGTEKIRLGKDALKPFDCCSMTLQPTLDPVITPNGWLYDKEAILTFILDKKKEYNKKMKQYEKQLEGEKQAFRDKETDAEEARKARFEATEKNIITKRVEAFTVEKAAESIKNTATEERKRHLPAFWMPAMGPQAKKTKLVKPDKLIYCPMSRKPLKMKDLVAVKWTLMREAKGKSQDRMCSLKERFQCAVSGDILYDSTPCYVLKTTGHVVTKDVVDKIIRKDMSHPLTGESLKEKDLIKVQRGASGFSASAPVELLAEKWSAPLPC